MKKFMMRFLMGSCMEATILMAKKEEGRLSFIEKMKLSIHTAMCSFCSKFEKQTCQIAEESKHVHSDAVLSALAKEKIERMLAGQ